MFSPGETVRHRFTIPFLASDLIEVIVSYKQDDYLIIEKTITSNFEGPEYETFGAQEGETVITVDFTQEESLLFEENKGFTIQLNVLTFENVRFASKPIKGCTGAQYHKEVISNE